MTPEEIKALSDERLVTELIAWVQIAEACAAKALAERSDNYIRELRVENMEKARSKVAQFEAEVLRRMNRPVYGWGVGNWEREHLRKKYEAEVKKELPLLMAFLEEPT